MLGFIFTLSAQVWNEYPQQTNALGIYYSFQIIPPGDNAFLHFFKASRIGMKLEYMFNFSSAIGMGIEVFGDVDGLTFYILYSGLDKKIELIYGFGGRVIFSIVMRNRSSYQKRTGITDLKCIMM